MNRLHPVSDETGEPTYRFEVRITDATCSLLHMHFFLRGFAKNRHFERITCLQAVVLDFISNKAYA